MYTAPARRIPGYFRRETEAIGKGDAAVLLPADHQLPDEGELRGPAE